MHAQSTPLLDTPRVGDGSILAALRDAGWTGAHPTDLANLDDPQRVRDAAAAFLDAGATLICTNTLNSNRFLLERHGRAGAAADLCRRAAELCVEARTRRRPEALVAGQIGPTGRFLTLEEIDEAEATDLFAAQASALKAGGCDVLLCARFRDPAELALAVRAAREATGLPVLAALIFDSGADRIATVDGTDPVDAAIRLSQAGADAVGCDCAAPESALTVVRRMARVSDRPVFARTNAGTAELREGRVGYSESPKAFAGRAAQLRAAGAVIVAGCCGATPAHIRALGAALR